MHTPGQTAPPNYFCPPIGAFVMGRYVRGHCGGNVSASHPKIGPYTDSIYWQVVVPYI